MKDVGLRIRVQRELREEFLAVCQAQDKPAAQVIREFMRAYVAEYQALDEPTKIEIAVSKLKAAGTRQK